MEERAPTLREVVVADDAPAWRAAGFAVDGDAVVLGPVVLRLAGRGSGPRLRLGIEGLRVADPDGIPAGPPLAPAPPAPAGLAHPNGSVAVDHVVAISPRLDRTIAALEAAGLPLRRVREQPTPAGAPRQAFFHLRTAILEVVQEPPEAVERGGGPERAAFPWGLALVCEDLDATAALLGDGASPVRAAVQPGRRIVSLRRAAGLALPLALMSPR